MIYHVCTQNEWKKALADGYYEAPSFATEGFIHASTREQVAGVLERYYAGKPDLILLHIDETLLGRALKYELAPSLNELFPHVYGRLNIGAVVKTTAT